MARPTILDIAKANAADAAVGLIEESIQAHPELTGVDPWTGNRIANVGEARTIRGTEYKTLVRTAIPTVSYRNANEGTAATKGTLENRLVETFILTPRAEADKAVADGYEDGWQAYMAIEQSANLEGAFRQMAKAFYYGRDSTHGDVKAHPGLLQGYDATNMVVDAGGTTADTASSVWLVKWGIKDVRWVFGNDGANMMPTEIRIGDVSDGSNNFTAYISDPHFYPGVQVGSTVSIVRIKKLTADAGKGMTDDLFYQAIEKFPNGVRPDCMFMTKRSRRQLQNSRTATNATGSPAPMPTEIEGVPILSTDGISNTEALTL